MAKIDTKTVRREMRLTVKAEKVASGDYGRTREITLESREANGPWKAVMFDLNKPCEPLVVDLIRWAESIGLKVEYDPPDNMRWYFNSRSRKRDDQEALFT